MTPDERDQLLRDARALCAFTMGLCVGRKQFFESTSEANISAFFDTFRVIAEKVADGIEEICCDE